MDGFYVSGWIKTGPTGVIADTMYGSYETAESIVIDYRNDKIPIKRERVYNHFQKTLKANENVVLFEDWKKADRQEIRLGVAKHKIREKIVDVDHMVRVAKGV